MKILISLFVCVFVIYFNLMAADKEKADHDHDHENGETQKPGKKQDSVKASKDEDHSSHDDHDDEEHGSKDKPEEHSEHKEDDHGEGEKHGEHTEGAEENPQVGPTKGILEFNESLGFKLSPEAEKNFKIQKTKVTSAGTIEVSKEAILTAVSEVNIFRYRDGYYKRIDFVTISQLNNKVLVKSKDLKPNDEVVVRGLGFLRIAELAAFGGAPEGHSH